MLQRQSGFALLVELMYPLQALAQSAGQHRQQRVILGGERSMFGQFDPDDEHPLRVLQRDTRRPRLARCRW